MIARARRDDYGRQHGEVSHETGAICRAGSAWRTHIACLNIPLLDSVLAAEVGASRYLVPLCEAAGVCPIMRNGALWSDFATGK